ncbi:MAG: NAD(P)/FAD-dependent oxidoreductase [Rubrobacter sp.]|nr:NAD(P)/FAD-dependent oxidoreductase [Rubrobacter sp.]
MALGENSDRLIDHEDPKVGESIQEISKERGVDIRVSRRVEESHRGGGDKIATLDDGEEVETDILVMVAGRTPRVEEIGLESVGVDVDQRGLPTNDRCQINGAAGLWAIGDVTGIFLFTHVAQYQVRVAVDNILGGDRKANYLGIPRVVFTDPEIAVTGMPEEEARQKGIDVASVTLDLPKVLSRSATYEKESWRTLGLVADRKERVLIGAWAIAPLAGERIHQACWAIRTSIDILLDGVLQFPTFSQGYLEALEQLNL